MITIEHLTKSFRGRGGPVVALDDVTLDVPAGAIVGVMGPSGSGKSTLVRLVALQDRPDSGIIRLDGQSTAGLDPQQLRAVRSRISIVPKGELLLAQRTVAGNIAGPLERAGVAGGQRRAKVGQLLDLVGLTDRAAAHPVALTPGQRRRVAVARALVGEPTVLLADDPTTELDPDGAAGVLTALDRACAELDVTVLVATADPNAIRKIADGVAILEHGRILERGNTLELAADPNSLVAGALLPTIDAAATGSGHDRVADTVLIGFAAVGALLPEASTRFGVEVSVLGGGLTRLGETPVARFRLGVSGEHADAAISWIDDRGGQVTVLPTGPRGIAA